MRLDRFHVKAEKSRDYWGAARPPTDGFPFPNTIRRHGVTNRPRPHLRWPPTIRCGPDLADPICWANTLEDGTLSFTILTIARCGAPGPQSSYTLIAGERLGLEGI
jgi:hypothetical protein